VPITLYFNPSLIVSSEDEKVDARVNALIYLKSLCTDNTINLN
jgi:hypothetical protein